MFDRTFSLWRRRTEGAFLRISNIEKQHNTFNKYNATEETAVVSRVTNCRIDRSHNLCRGEEADLVVLGLHFGPHD